MKRNIRLYLHHDRYEHIRVNHPHSPVGFVLFILRGLAQFIFYLCYYIGLALIFIPRKIIEQFTKVDLRSYSTHTIQRLWRSAAVRRSLVIYILTILSFNSGVMILHSIAEARQLKADLTDVGYAGVANLQEGIIALKQNNYQLAQEQFARALINIRAAKAMLDRSSLLLRSATLLLPQGNDARQLIEALELSTETAQDLSKTLPELQTATLGPQGVTGKDNTQPILKQLVAFVATNQQRLQRIAQLLSQINVVSIPKKQQNSFLTVRSLVKELNHNLENYNQLITLAEHLLSGKQHVLIAFLNNNELRPGGGFIGTIGSVSLQDGVITALDIRTVYDYDGQLKTHFRVPTPMLMANTRWFLRDTNWFADNRVNAQKLAQLYELSGGSKPDAILTITPDLAIDALKLTGPISLPQYGVTLTAENFIETVQVATSLQYDKLVNQPKQILADFVPILLQKLSEQPQSTAKLLNLCWTQLRTKNMAIYLPDPELQKLIEPYNWSGAVAATDRDYLQILRANLGGTKTDRGLRQNAELSVQIQTTGEVLNQLTYTVQNPFPNAERLENKTFVRFLLPQDSTIIQTEGFDTVTLPPESEDSDSTNDPVVKNWNDHMNALSNLSGFIGTEGDKTYYGNWLNVKGGETKTVKITYKLPFRLSTVDKYSLLLQKQLGSNIPVKLIITYPHRHLIWQNLELTPNGFDRVSAELTNTEDQLIGLVFQKP